MVSWKASRGVSVLFLRQETPWEGQCILAVLRSICEMHVKKHGHISFLWGFFPQPCILPLYQEGHLADESFFLLEMKMSLSRPGESAVGTRSHSLSTVALLSWRQLLVMRDQCLSFESSREKSQRCSSIVKNSPWIEGMGVEKCKITSL